MSTKLSIDKSTLEMIAAYDKALTRKTYVIYTKDDSIPFGGVSCEFMFFLVGSERVVVKWANGEMDTVPLSTISIRVDDSYGEHISESFDNELKF